MKNGIHHVTGVEHDETGNPSESAANRNVKWISVSVKLKHIRFNTPVYKNAPHEDADLLFVGFNSTGGAIEEAMRRLEKDGIKSKSCTYSFDSSVPS